MDWPEVASLVALLAFAVYGLRRGALRIALPVLGLVGAVVLVDRFADRFVESLRGSEWMPVIAVSAFLLCLLAGLQLGGMLGEAIASRLHLPLLTWADRLLGVVLGTCLGLVGLWLAGVLISTTGQQGRDAVRRSELVSRLLVAVPPDEVLTALHRFDDVPVVADFIPRRTPPEAVRGVPRAVLDRVSRSVVMVESSACGLRYEGSGWVAREGVVVTNVHVITGESEPVVTDADGDEHAATVVYADPQNDLALLAVPDLDAPALPLGPSPAFGAPLAFLGHPGGGPLRRSGATAGDTETVRTGDAYDRLTTRSVLVLRGRARPGNSGGPVVDARGRAVGTIAARDETGTLAIAVPIGAARAALEAPRAQVAAGPCPA